MELRGVQRGSTRSIQMRRCSVFILLSGCGTPEFTSVVIHPSDRKPRSIIEYPIFLCCDSECRMSSEWCGLMVISLFESADSSTLQNVLIMLSGTFSLNPCFLMLVIASLCFLAMRLFGQVSIWWIVSSVHLHPGHWLMPVM